MCRSRSCRACSGCRSGDSATNDWTWTLYFSWQLLRLLCLVPGMWIATGFPRGESNKTLHFPRYVQREPVVIQPTTTQVKEPLIVNLFRMDLPNTFSSEIIIQRVKSLIPLIFFVIFYEFFFCMSMQDIIPNFLFSFLQRNADTCCIHVVSMSSLASWHGVKFCSCTTWSFRLGQHHIETKHALKITTN